jgi:hypothetical protein
MSIMVGQAAAPSPAVLIREARGAGDAREGRHAGHRQDRNP